METQLDFGLMSQGATLLVVVSTGLHWPDSGKVASVNKFAKVQRNKNRPRVSQWLITSHRFVELKLVTKKYVGEKKHEKPGICLEYFPVAT